VSDRRGVLVRNLLVTALALAPVAAIAQAPAGGSTASDTDTAVATPAVASPALAAPPAATPAVASPETATLVTPPAGSGTEAPTAPLVPRTEPGPAQPGKPLPNPEDLTIEAPTETTGIAAIVNDYVISDYDLNQRTALFVSTSGVRPTKETLATIRAQVLRSLEDEVLELQEAQKHKISVTKGEVDKALQNIAEDNHLNVDQIVDTVKKAGVSVETLRQQIAAQLTWQRLVTARYGTDIFISDQQVDDAMKRLKEGADKPQFLVSEIFMGVDRPDDDKAVHDSAEKIVEQLHQGAAFNTVAGQVSQSPSAADGGDIGWVLQGQLEESLDQALEKMHPGDISGPIRSEGGYYIIALRDRREPAGTKVQEAKPAEADPNAPIPLDRLLIPLPPNPDEMLKQRVMTVGETLKTQLQSCEQLPMVATRLGGGARYSHLGTMDPKLLAPVLRDALAKTGPGEVVQPYFSPAGLEIIMRCDAAPPKPTVFKMPTRDQVEQQLFVQQMSVFAKSYLSELRRDAVVETR
jgi:peptidyl-prolyl cis-trans isomerase SurA